MERWVMIYFDVPYIFRIRVCSTFHFPILEVCTLQQIVGFLNALYKDCVSILQVTNVVIQN